MANLDQEGQTIDNNQLKAQAKKKKKKMKDWNLSIRDETLDYTVMNRFKKKKKTGDEQRGTSRDVANGSDETEKITVG